MTDRPKLGAKFAAPTTQRSAPLAGLLATNPQPAATERPEPAPAAVSVADRPTAPNRTTDSRGKSGKTTGAGVSGSPQTYTSPARNKIVPIVLDASVLAELRTFASRTEQTQGSVALRAIEAHADALQTHWRIPQAPTTGTLFAISTQVHRRVEPGVQTQLRISPQDAATLDNLASEWGAPSRSALVNEALRRYVMRPTRESAG